MRIAPAFLVVLACGKSEAPPDRKPDPKPAASDAGAATTPPAIDAAQAPAAAKLPQLKVTVDGKPIAMQSAIAVDEGDGTIALSFANFPHTCKEEHDGFRSTYPDEVQFKLRVNHRLAKDGTLGWGIRGTYFDSTSSEKQTGTKPLAGATIDPAAGAKSKVTLDFTQKGPGDTSKTLVVKGTAEIEGCGVNPKRKPPELPVAQPGAFITIAGKQMPISGAAFIVNRSGDRMLEVATGPVKCVDGSDYVSSGFPDLSIELAWSKATGKLYRAELGGTWIEDWAANQSGDIALTAAPNRAPPGAKEMTVKLGGTTTVSDYPIALAGTIKVTVCPTPPPSK